MSETQVKQKDKTKKGKLVGWYWGFSHKNITPRPQKGCKANIPLGGHRTRTEVERRTWHMTWKVHAQNLDGSRQFVLGINEKGWLWGQSFEAQDEACVTALRQPSQGKACFGSPVSLYLNHTCFLTSLDLVVTVCVWGLTLPNSESNSPSLITKEGWAEVRGPEQNWAVHSTESLMRKF